MCTCFVARVGGAGGEPVGCALASFLAPEAALPPPWPTAKPLRLYMSNLAVLPEHQRRGVAAALLRACEVLGASRLLLPHVMGSVVRWLACAWCPAGVQFGGCPAVMQLIVGFDTWAKRLFQWQYSGTCTGPAQQSQRPVGVPGRRWGQDSLWLHTYSDNKGAIALYERSGYTLHSERRRLSSLWTGKKERLYVKYLQQLSRSEDAESGEVVSVSGSVRASDGAFVWDAVSARETTRL